MCSCTWYDLHDTSTWFEPTQCACTLVITRSAHVVCAVFGAEDHTSFRVQHSLENLESHTKNEAALDTVGDAPDLHGRQDHTHDDDGRFQHAEQGALRNVALGKHAYQSSSVTPATLAVDGVTAATCRKTCECLTAHASMYQGFILLFICMYVDLDTRKRM
jgi:hypothetical protein